MGFVWNCALACEPQPASKSNRILISGYLNWWTHKLGGLHKNNFITAALFQTPDTPIFRMPLIEETQTNSQSD
jgi:hypothetical protein